MTLKYLPVKTSRSRYPVWTTFTSLQNHVEAAKYVMDFLEAYLGMEYREAPNDIPDPV